MRRRSLRIVMLIAFPIVVVACSESNDTSDTLARDSSAEESPYLFLFAGDLDEADSDFLAVIDLRPNSADFGKAIATTPIGMKASMPHRMRCLQGASSSS